MRKVSRLMMTAVLLIMVGIPAQADPSLDAILDLVARSTTPIIVGVSTTTGGGRTTDVEMSSFQEAPPGDPLIDIGSITKLVTAVAVLNLVEEGHLSLTTPISDLLEGVPEDKRDITIHQLLTHSSGLIESTGSDEEVLDRTAFIARLMAAPLQNPPRERYLYSNAGYSLLAAIIELKSGGSYESYLRGNLLAPSDLPAIGYASVYREDRSLRSGQVNPCMAL